MLIKNDLLRYAAPAVRTIRVLWLDRPRNLAYVFELESKASHPRLVALSSLVADIQTRRAQLLLRDPYMVRADVSQLPPRYREVRDRAWAIVRELVACEPDIYQARLRGPLVMEQSRLHGVTHPSVYRYLRRYWERGQTPDALLPDYANSGARGKTRGSNANVKRGRPRKDGRAPGVNADPQVRATFRSAVARYVATHDQFSRRGAYRQMIEEFYTARAEDALPTFGQFSYWIDKDSPVARG
jgi:hypothetical protein